MPSRAGGLSLVASLLLAATLAAAAGCSKPRQPNIVWIVWDTVRADHLSVYGYDRETTPNLARWAAGARVYEDCLSTAGYTLPSHASMFTGLLPGEHCTHNDHRRLDDRWTTIAQLLGGAGYRTYLYSANPHISRAGGFDRGFDRADHPWTPALRERATRIVRDKLIAEDVSSELGETLRRLDSGELKGMSVWNMKATGALAGEAILDWLDSTDPSRPFFVFANYMEAHRPLIPARRYRERVMSPAEVERSYRVNRSWIPTWEFTFGLREYSTEELELTRATYDAAIAELDDLFGRLLADLDAGGYLENTVVIVTSDHGEHLGEQHMLDHQYSVYQPLLRVPLIVHDPSRFEPGRESRPVVNFDLFPTLLEAAGVAPPAGLDSTAVSLLDPLEERSRLAEDPAPSKVAIATVQASHPEWDPTPWERKLRALVGEGRKLIWGSDGRHELYDLSVDPGENDNLYEQRPEEARRRLEALDELYASLQVCEPGAPAPEFTPEQVERLEALGYVGK